MRPDVFVFESSLRYRGSKKGPYPSMDFSVAGTVSLTNGHVSTIKMEERTGKGGPKSQQYDATMTITYSHFNSGPSILPPPFRELED
jgi:hypothetical protein